MKKNIKDWEKVTNIQNIYHSNKVQIAIVTDDKRMKPIKFLPTSF